MIVVYGKAGCKFCQLAKEYLDNVGLEYKYIDIMEDYEAGLALKGKYGMFKTLPQIVIDNELIGGYSELTNIM